jgi:hypothetical protein
MTLYRLLSTPSAEVLHTPVLSIIEVYCCAHPDRPRLTVSGTLHLSASSAI